MRKAVRADKERLFGLDHNKERVVEGGTEAKRTVGGGMRLGRGTTC